MSEWFEQAWLFVRHPLVLPLFVTGVAGFVALLAARVAVISRVVALIAVAGTLGLTIELFRGVEYAMDATWFEMEGIRLAVAMSNGTFSALIAMGATFFGLLVAFYAQTAERGQPGEGKFHALLCWTLTGAIGAALADDLIWLLICWEIVTLCLYLMLTLGRGDSPAGASKTFAMIGFGDAAMVLAIALIGATQGTFRIDELTIQVGTPLTYICYLLFMVAALAKAGAIPMHSWIPAAATDASASVFAFLPAALDKLLGIYLLALFSLQVFVLDAAMQTVLMVIGAVTIIAAVLMAMMQHHLKKLLSFHAVSQVGYMVLGIGTGVPLGVAGGIFHMINNAIYKSCLFLGAGVVERRTGTSEMNQLGGLARVLPGTFLCCAIAALAISGIPPLNGFVSKWLVYQSCLSLGTPLALLCLIAAVFGSALTLASFFKVLAAVFLGPETVAARRAGPVNGAITLILPMAILAALCIGFGIFAQWPLTNLIVPAIAETGVDTTALAATSEKVIAGEIGLWGPETATALLALGAIGGLVLYMISRSQVRVTKTFIGGELMPEPSPLKYPASSFYRTVEDMPGLGAALHDGSSSAYDVYRMGSRYGGSLIDVLRKQHTGVLSLYVSWCLVGVVVIVVCLMTANRGP